MKFLLFFALFSLPLMAQEDKTQGGGIKDIGKISKEFPLYLIDGKKLSRWSLKTKRLQPDEIAEILLFLEKRLKIFLATVQNTEPYISSLRKPLARLKLLQMFLLRESSIEESDIIEKLENSIKRIAL